MTLAQPKLSCHDCKSEIKGFTMSMISTTEDKHKLNAWFSKLQSKSWELLNAFGLPYGVNSVPSFPT